MVNGSIRLLAQYFADPNVEPLSGLDCMLMYAVSTYSPISLMVPHPDQPNIEPISGLNH